MSNRERMFLINYLSDRAIFWHIDESVLEKYPHINTDISFLIKHGYIVICHNKYTLTSLGLEEQKAFRSNEKRLKNMMTDEVLSLSLSGNYLDAFNARASYERGCVIPHGICSGFGGESGLKHMWEEKKTLPDGVKNSIKRSLLLDFNDCDNSDYFKEMLRRYYVAEQIEGSSRMTIPHNFENMVGERLLCRNLDSQLQQKCTFDNPNKLQIYYCTKRFILNVHLTCDNAWDGKFILGTYDCTNPRNAALSEYKSLENQQISGFPKTFQTYYKHKNNMSEKYKTWISDAESQGWVRRVIDEIK